GRLLAAESHPDDAIREFNRALEFGDDWRFYDSRADVLFRAKRYDEALADYDRAVALAPLASEPTMSRALLLAVMERPDPSADRGVAAIARLDPTSSDLENFRTWPVRKSLEEGIAHYEAGRWDEAIAVFTRVHESAPGKSDALSRRGSAYL